MLFRHVLLSILTVIPSVAQSFAPPLVGIAVDKENHLRPVYGMAGNFILGEAGGKEVLSAAFSGKSGIVKTDSQVLLLDQTGAIVNAFSAPAGGAVFAFHESGAAALCYFESTGELWRIGTDGLDPLPVPVIPDGEQVLAIAEGKFVTGKPTGPVLIVPGGMLIAGREGLVLRSNDGSRKRLAVPGQVRKLRQIGDGWVQVVTTDAHYALRVDGALLYRLPG